MIRSLACVCLLAGCSFVFVDGPPARHREMPAFSCTESRLVPVLDTIWTVLQTANLLVAVSTSNEKWDEQFGGDAPISRGASVVLYAGLAALGAGGMYFGYSRTARCRAAKQELYMRQGGQQPPPGTWPPPTWPPPSQPLQLPSD